MSRLRLVAVLLVALMAVLLAGCGLFGSDPRDAAAAFLDAVSRGDTAGAGRLTDDPVAATELIRQLREELKPQHVQLTVDEVRSGDRIASASFAAVWDLGRGRQWRYQGAFELVPATTSDGWLVRWAPEVLHPRLGADQLVTLRDIPAEPAPVVDRVGTPLLTSQTVVTVALDRSAIPDLAAAAAQLATALGRFDPQITQQSIIAAANAAPAGQPSAVAMLRESDYVTVRDQIDDLPGVSFPTQQRLLGPDRDFASQLLPGLRKVVEQQLDNAAGWRIVTVNAMGQ
ncbi:MAG: NTF2-like N-terminal transpeptidase domain-containing protein, partial [Pseudonocardiaceae bacterium]